MNWKYILDTNKFTVAGSGIHKTIKIVKIAGYKFFNWNDDILFLNPNGNAEKTGIKVKDCF